eukprot:TRINITY_DN10591_c0_g1_i1.p1 TRINITY_DN10591_c0_g1~~TRINITY_DN10591_c0_g1_i1.p1  ORF type:complete len:826 (+),score=147.18 TRINITY_DN10591_c0_g1_i1:127-2604(+)
MTSWLQINVVEGRNLTSKDPNGFSDPYLVLTYKEQNLKTKVKNRTLNPKWSENYSFLLDGTTDDLHIGCYDHDFGRKDDFIGEFYITADVLEEAEYRRFSNWYVLRSGWKQTRGEIKIELYVETENITHHQVEGIEHIAKQVIQNYSENQQDENKLVLVKNIIKFLKLNDVENREENRLEVLRKEEFISFMHYIFEDEKINENSMWLFQFLITDPIDKLKKNTKLVNKIRKELAKTNLLSIISTILRENYNNEIMLIDALETLYYLSRPISNRKVLYNTGFIDQLLICITEREKRVQRIAKEILLKLSGQHSEIRNTIIEKGSIALRNYASGIPKSEIPPDEIYITNTGFLPGLILTMEDIENNMGVTDFIDNILGVDNFYLSPRNMKPMYHRNRETNEEMNDVIVLSELVAGYLDPWLITKCTEEQIYWYLPLFLTYKGPNMDGVCTTLKDQLHKSNLLSQLVCWVLDVSQLAYELPLTLWRRSHRQRRTEEFFQSLLEDTDMIEGQVWEDIDIINPVNGLQIVNKVSLNKIFSSAARPLLLELESSLPDVPSYRIIFKGGDDLRQDLVVQTIFYIFNKLWHFSHIKPELKPFIYQYRVVPMGNDKGSLEFVEGCVTMGSYDWSKIPNMSREEKLQLMRSAAGSYVASWALGIRDRHQDNMMIKDDFTFFHIDFGWMFGQGPLIDAPIFSIPTGFKRNLSKEEWKLFKRMCCMAFATLHRNAGLVINLSCKLFTNIVSSGKVRKFMCKSLMVKEMEEDAMEKINELVNQGSKSFQKELKYFTHTIATSVSDKKIKKRNSTGNKKKHSNAKKSGAVSLFDLFITN